VNIGNRELVPSLFGTVLAIVAIVAFVSLGRWQWARGETRELQWKAFEMGGGKAQPLGARPLDAIERFQRVSIQGEFDAQHQFLLDNTIREGRAGYEVLTPFHLADGRWMLVDRGWIAGSGYRDRLPRISLQTSGAREIPGRVDELPVAGLAQGHAAPASDASWPKVTSFPTSAELGAALGRKLEKRILLLDPHAPDGYLREWQPPGLPPSRHFGYAIQWWTFVVAALALWMIVSLRKRTPAV
jgi:surfeit locus 1 family protein